MLSAMGSKVKLFHIMLDRPPSTIMILSTIIVNTTQAHLSRFPFHFYMTGVDLMVRVVGFGFKGPEFNSRSAVELLPGGVNSTCHPSEVGQHAGILCRSGDPSRIVPNSQGDCFGSTYALHRVWSQSPLLLTWISSDCRLELKLDM